MLDRRNLMKALGLTAMGGILARFAGLATSDAQSTSTASGPYSLPSLPYGYDALEPFIDTQTMHLHHDKHHAGYVRNLNAAVANYADLAKLPVEDLVRGLDRVPEAIRQTVRNNGGGHANHSLFWQVMQKGAPGKPTGKLARALDEKFGSFSAFQDQFTKAALGVFGSGWAWLSLNEKKELAIETSPNQDSPWMSGRIPIFGIDVWEHAYYLKYQNVRADYVTAFYKVISWNFVNGRYEKAITSGA